MNKDYYQVLGVEKTASDEDIKKAYRKLAHQYHPDKSGGDEAKFKEINEAYQILSNKEKRAQYDRFGHAGPFGGGFDFGQGFGFNFDPNNLDGFGGINDIFDAFFEGLGVKKKRKSYERGADIEIVQEISLEEAFRGVERAIKLRIHTPCGKCSALGYFADAGVKECSSCNGRGEVKENRSTFFGSFSQIRSCEKCAGNGQIPNKLCSDCRGSGRVSAVKESTIQIAPGVEDGQVIKLSGGGEAGERGAGTGDLYIRIKVTPHKVFGRRGADLFIKKEISLLDALLEIKIEVPTIGGNKIFVTIPPGFNLKENLRVPGEGMTKLGGYGRGDLYIEWEVRTPKKINSKTKKILDDLRGEI